MELHPFEIMVFVFLVNAAIPLALGIIDTLICFWKRNPRHYYYTRKYQKAKLFWLKEKYWDPDRAARAFVTKSPEQLDNSIVLESWSINDIALPTIIFWTVLSAAALYCHNPMILLYLAIFLIVIFVPRYVHDILSMLKYNPKTNDSERIAKLESEINKLK